MSDIRKCNNASFEMAIADFFHCENIPDRVVDSERFARVIKKARTVGSDFNIPSRSKIGGELLDLNFETVYKANKEALLKDASVFGLAFLGDGATIKRMPLMNILGMCAGTPPLTLSIQDCTDHMEEGVKKNAAYIAEMFEAKVNEYDAGNLLTDVFFFDGASNVQKAGEVLTAKFPHTFCFHGAEHVVSLFFSSIARIQPIKVLILKACRLYQAFGLGSHHGIYAQFIAQSSMANKGKKIGLLRGASTRMASWFYAMMRLLWLRLPLKATIHQQKFLDLHLTPSVRSAMRDIDDDNFWKSMYILLRAVFPALRALCFCDSSLPVMDKIYFLSHSHRTTEAIKRSEQSLNDDNLFGRLEMDDVSLRTEAETVFGDDFSLQQIRQVDGSDDDNGGGAFDDSSEDSSDDDAGDYGGYDFGQRVLWHWEHRKSKIEHDYAITGWALSVIMTLMNALMKTTESTEMRLRGWSSAFTSHLVQTLIQKYWVKMKGRLLTCSGMSSRPSVIVPTHSTNQAAGQLLMLLQLGGIGPAERSWAGVKQIKDGKRSHLGSDSTEKRAILLVTAKIKEAKIRRDIMEKIDASGPDAMFGDDDINFDLQLENFGVDTSVLRQPVVQRIFCAWVEDGEQEDRRVNDPVAEARLLAKYKNLVFNDPDTGTTMSIWDKNMEFWRGKSNGWMVIATSADDNVEDEPFALEVVCDLIGQTQQIDGVTIIHKQVDEVTIEDDE
ncbi:hypothetical protein ACHAWU_008070 [Discostella pseudostelligera]|uniref:DUF659 domain-containing protein n=1 Tax=Discostella pseudostelligera TaxID=259834 RepID=A0ABD3N7N8_9STRA